MDVLGDECQEAGAEGTGGVARCGERAAMLQHGVLVTQPQQLLRTCYAWLLHCLHVPLR